jgi:hypothetical protein
MNEVGDSDSAGGVMNEVEAPSLSKPRGRLCLTLPINWENLYFSSS